MTLYYGKTSERRLQECHYDLQFVFREALNMGIIDIAILEGHRPKEKQDEYCEIASEVENIMETFFEKGE